MTGDAEPSSTHHQAVAERKYAALKRAVEDAGYFAPQVVGDEDREHLVCTSKYQEGYGYTGRILFVTEVRGNWYVATPHPYHYRVLVPNQVEQAVIGFFEQQLDSDGTIVIGDGHQEATLIWISGDEYELAVARVR